ncbi:MAG: amidase [Xanthobacteraceae bacterium]|nr:amidase [Xanthobacteraceae bacterium]
MAAADAAGAFVPGARLTRRPSGAGPLNGLSFAVKDLIDVAGAPTGGGNPDWLASHDCPRVSAPVVDALLGAGATLTGKTITDELAFSLEGVNAHDGTPRNPACPDRIPGGSSSGSASAVAAGLVDFALGTDTGGSVRVPASFVGIFGFRPTHGAVSLAGVTPFAPSYDTVGWFARDIATLAAVGDVLLPNAPPAPIRRLRLVRDAFALADPAVAAALRSRCEGLAIDDEVTLFDGTDDDWRECYRVLQGAEIWRELGPWITAVRPRFGDAIAPRFADAAAITANDVARWTPVRATLRSRVAALLGDGVGLVLPTAPCIALRKDAAGLEISDFYRRALTLTSIAGHAGLPQITVPAGRVDGCPVGLSIVAAAGCDRALLDVSSRWAALALTEEPI